MTMKQNRILLLSPFYIPNVGGAETFIQDLVKFLNGKREGVDVITYQPLMTMVSAPKVERKNGNLIYRIPWIRGKWFYKFEKYPFVQLIYLSTGLLFFSFYYLISGKSKKITIVNCHGMAAGFVGYILSFFVKKRFILTFHTNYRFSTKQIIGRFILKMAERFDGILALSSACAKNLQELGIQEEKIVQFYNWVDEEQYKPRDKSKARKKLGWKQQGFYALFIARFIREKGIADLIESVPMLDKEINLVIIGEGPYQDQVIEIANKYPNVTYLGRKKAEELPIYFNASDILVYASIDEDYLSRVAISAFLCGLPIMIPSQTETLGKINKVKLKLPEKTNVKFRNDPESFAKELNKTFLDKENFAPEAAIKYIKGIYGRDINGLKYFNQLIGENKDQE